MDRLLRPLRQPHGLSTAKPGRLLKKQIPIRTFTEWTDVEPGFLEGDLVKPSTLDDAGRVRDGQNRLHAIVPAGIPLRPVVARGVSEDAFEVMDTGRSSNAADGLHIHSNLQT